MASYPAADCSTGEEEFGKFYIFPDSGIILPNYPRALRLKPAFVHNYI